jgi:hypothetical protein
MVVSLAIIIFGGLFSYTFYIIFSTVSNKFKLALVRLSTIGTTVSTQVTTTVVTVQDSELNEVLEVVFNEIGNSTEIPMSLLNNLGLYTPTVVVYLQNLGYTIIIG